MPAARLNLTAERGASFYREIAITGTPIPVGTTFQSRIFDTPLSDAPLMAFASAPLTVETGVSFTLELQPDLTTYASLPEKSYWYRVEATVPDTLAVIRVLYGQLRMLP